MRLNAQIEDKLRMTNMAQVTAMMSNPHQKAVTMLSNQKVVLEGQPRYRVIEKRPIIEESKGIRSGNEGKRGGNVGVK